MITVFGRPDSSAVARVMWVIGELGLEHERIDWGGPFGGNDQSDYRAMCPSGKIPAIRLSSGACLWESNTIIRYLCSLHPQHQLLPEAGLERARVEAWMDWSGAFQSGVSSLRKTYKAADVTHAQIATSIATAKPIFEVLNTQLSGNTYVAGADFTAADIALGVWAHRLWRCPNEAKPSGLEPIWNWVGRLQLRPAYRLHVMDKVSAGPQSVGGG